jgi:hypothetical protein
MIDYGLPIVRCARVPCTCNEEMRVTNLEEGERAANIGETTDVKR